MLSYFVIVFWLVFFNSGQLISAIVTVCCCYHHGEKKVSIVLLFLYFVGIGSVAAEVLAVAAGWRQPAWQRRW